MTAVSAPTVQGDNGEPGVDGINGEQVLARTGSVKKPNYLMKNLKKCQFEKS